MLELTIWMAILTGFYTAPIVHWRMRRTKCWGVRAIIAGLVFTPGLCAAALWVWFVTTLRIDATRWSLVNSLHGDSALKYLVIAEITTATYLGGCLLLEHFPKREDRDRDGGVIRVVDAWRSLVVIQLALITVTVYLYNYNTLGDAVTNDDLPLAERRLNWNLEGLGPNDGLIVDGTTWTPKLAPLLPVAIQNGNYDIVKLLVNHGAVLKQTDGDAGVEPPAEGTYEKRLYSAVREGDFEMIELLIDLGVAPEHGVASAITKRDRELMDFLLEKGVSREFALGEGKQRYLSQEKIDFLFADQVPGIEVEAAQ